MGLFSAVRRIAEAEFVRFLIAGGINTAFGYLVFAASYFVLQHEAAALAVDYTIGAFFNFMSYSKIAFSKYGKKRFAWFVAVYVAVYFLNHGILVLLMSRCGLNAYAAQLAALFICPVVLYVLLRKLVFVRG